jgi:hypothetical protein
MGCVLHFTGDLIDVDALAAISPTEPCTKWKKGEPRSKRPNAKLCTTSGISIVISDAEFENFEDQQQDAINYVTAHHSALAVMRNAPGITHASLDFGIAMRNVFVQSDSFSAELLASIGLLRLTLVLTQYPVGQKFKRIKQYRRSLRRAA